MPNWSLEKQDQHSYIITALGQAELVSYLSLSKTAANDPPPPEGLRYSHPIDFRVLSLIRDMTEANEPVNNSIIAEKLGINLDYLSGTVMPRLMNNGFVLRTPRIIEGVSPEAIQHLNIGMLNGWKIIKALVDKGVIDAQTFWSVASDPKMLGARGEREALEAVAEKLPKPSQTEAPKTIPPIDQPPAAKPTPSPETPPIETPPSIAIGPETEPRNPFA